MVKANQEIRNAAKEAGVYLWQIADRLGIKYDTYFSKMLRRELPKEKQEQIMAIITEIQKED